MSHAVEFRNITKLFPGAKVLDNINFAIEKGTVHALLGENGAGKSTLLNILHGVYADYQGDVLLDGEKVVFKNPHDAILNGRISKVHQETNVVRDLTVGQNVTLGYEPRRGPFVDYGALNNRVDEILDQLKCRFRADDMAGSLTTGEMQMMAIAKALFNNSRVISLDEPTASLTGPETDTLFQVIEQLKNLGITLIYVSHRLEEVFRICDKATILRDGAYITTLDVAKTTREELIHNMVGHNVSAVATRTRPCLSTGEEVLRVENLIREGVFADVSFSLNRGEILGFSGLVGAGRTEVMRAIFGADKKTGGEVYLHGRAVRIRNTQDALKLGIGLLPEERKTQGFSKLATNVDNISISSLENYRTGPFIDDRKKYSNTMAYVGKLHINPPRPEQLTQFMSGGNQQKIILARWMSTRADILIFDEPTKGVDVAVKAEIYRIMEEMAQAGKALIVVSSELPEVVGISDRIIVMCEGRITAELQRDAFEEQRILNYAMGGNTDA